MTETTYQIGNMDCANCAKEVESGVAKLDGVQFVRVDFASGKMTLSGDVDANTLRQRVEALGKTLISPTDTPDDTPKTTQRGGVIGFWDYLTERFETRLALFGGALVIVALVAELLGTPEIIVIGGYIAGMLVTLAPIARSGFNALRINRTFNINLLMTIAAFGAMIIGEYLESATVIFLFAIGEALEGYTTSRARHSIQSLIALKPNQAILLEGDRELTVPVADLKPGDRILVKPGDQIPMDGRIETGNSGVNQAPITGESLPVTKQAGDDVFAGTINGEGALTIEVTRPANDTLLSRIIKMVEEAQSVRAPSQRFIDRFASYYTPAVVVLATAVALIPPIFFNAPFYDTPEQHGWLYRALAMLVIACPCALVISTPVTVISAITAAARRGVLIKGGAHLEALGTIRAFAFDKTGTLTAGQPTVTAYHTLNCDNTDHSACEDVLALASAVERRTRHPLADAVVATASAHAVADRYTPAESVEMLAGRGVRGVVDGQTVTIGSHALFDEAFPHTPELCQQLDTIEAAGNTTMLLAQGDDVRGYIALADTARDISRDVIRQLNAQGMTTVMLTGDNARVAQAVGQQVGVTDVRAGLLPEDKVTAVKELTEKYQHVAMVGDGVNDTPALTAATVGIAMGGAGSPQALETADIALMQDDLSQLPFAVQLSRFARQLIKQNIVISMAVKALFLVLAALGLTSLWLAILADVGMSLLVTLNGMRPLRG